MNLFYKDIKDYFRRQTQEVPFPGADGNTYDYLISRPVNVGTAEIRGAELGWNQFFDLPLLNSEWMPGRIRLSLSEP